MTHLNLKAPVRATHYSQLDLARTVFLAGSISNAADWQKEATDLLLPHFNIFNPRRDSFDVLNPEVEREQIQWEYTMLALAGITLFNFTPETLAPITLFEYGKQLVKTRYEPFRKTYVCIHPNYQRKNDVLIQTECANPSLLKNFFTNLETMCKQIICEHS